MHDLIVGLEGAAGVLVVGLIMFGIVSQVWAMLGPDRTAGLSADDPVWSGQYARALPVMLAATSDQALNVAFAAVSRVGSCPAERWDPWTVVGWYNNWGLWPRFQLAIVLHAEPNGRIRMLCCARPRWSRTLLDLGVSRNRAVRLVRAVNQLATQLGILAAEST